MTHSSLCGFALTTVDETVWRTAETRANTGGLVIDHEMLYTGIVVPAASREFDYATFSGDLGFEVPPRSINTTLGDGSRFDAIKTVAAHGTEPAIAVYKQYHTGLTLLMFID